MIYHSTKRWLLLSSYCLNASKTICCSTVNTWWLLFLCRNSSGILLACFHFLWRNSPIILACFKTRNMVSASLTYLDSFNKYTILLFHYEALIRWKVNDFYRASDTLCHILYIYENVYPSMIWLILTSFYDAIK